VTAFFSSVRKILADGSVWRFLGVGVGATLIDFAVFSFLVLQTNFQPAPANLVSYPVSLVFNFNANRRWTFRQSPNRATALRQVRRFLLVNAGGLMLSTAIIAVLSLLTTDLLSKVISVPIVFVWNYAFARLWVFRDAQSRSDKA